MKQYRLEMDWFGFKKGETFGVDTTGWLVMKITGDTVNIRPQVVDLLVLSGALSLVEEVELPEEFSPPYGSSFNKSSLEGKINELIRYLKANRK